MGSRLTSQGRARAPADTGHLGRARSRVSVVAGRRPLDFWPPEPGHCPFLSTRLCAAGETSIWLPGSTVCPRFRGKPEHGEGQEAAVFTAL